VSGGLKPGKVKVNANDYTKIYRQGEKIMNYERKKERQERKEFTQEPILTHNPRRTGVTCLGWMRSSITRAGLQ
jgi:hypothetical protein